MVITITAQIENKPVGTVAGRVGMFGGPLNPTTGRMALDDSPADRLVVSATSTDHHIVKAMTGTDGRFTHTLAPGHYAVTTCAHEVSVTVTTEEQSVVNLACDVP